MIRSKKLLDWIIKERLKLSIEDNEKGFIVIIFIAFPSTLKWALFGDMSIIDKLLPEDERTEYGYDLIIKAFLNSLIINDIINDTADLGYEGLTSIACQSCTDIDLFKIDNVEIDEGSMEALQVNVKLLGLVALQRSDLQVEIPANTPQKCPTCDNNLMWVYEIDRFYCDDCDKIISHQ